MTDHLNTQHITTTPLNATMLLPTLLLGSAMLAYNLAMVSSTPTGAVTDDNIPGVIGRGFNGIGLVCETSQASPTFSEIDYMVMRLHKFASCLNTNPFGSHCTELIRYEGGNVAICGSYWGNLDCHDVASAVDNIRDNCADWNAQRSGGQFVVNTKMKVILY